MNGILFDELLAVLAGICSVSYLYFGIYIAPTARKDPRFRFLAYACFFSSVWSFCYIMYFLTGDPDMKNLWQRFTFAGMLAFLLYLMFFIRFSEVIRNRKAVVLTSIALAVPSLVTAYKSMAENAVARDFPSGFWFLFAQILTTIYNLGSIVLLVMFFLKNKTNKSRKQVIILCVSGFILVTLAWIADYIFFFQGSQNIIPFWLLIWIGILIYTIKNYRFITITPDFISRDITENIDEGILLLDTKFRVIFRNRSARAMLNAAPEDEVPWKKTVIEQHILEDGFSRLMKSDADSARIRVTVRQRGSGGKTIPVDLKIKKVIDSFNDLSGYLIIVSMVKDLDHLKAMRGITARELDVIRQLVIGKSNREIADQLKVALRTVEAHVANIYDKLGVGNRIELLNILADYDSFQVKPVNPNMAAQ